MQQAETADSIRYAATTGGKFDDVTGARRIVVMIGEVLGEEDLKIGELSEIARVLRVVGLSLETTESWYAVPDAVRRSIDDVRSVIGMAERKLEEMIDVIADCNARAIHGMAALRLAA